MQLVTDEDDEQSSMFDRDNPSMDEDDEQSSMFDRDDPSSPTTDQSTAMLGKRKHLTRHANIKHLPIDCVVPQSEQPGTSARGQIDTGVTVSCSNVKHLFHNCEECNDKCEFPIRPCAAVDKNMTTPT